MSAPDAHRHLTEQSWVDLHDREIAARRRIVFAESKRESGKLSPAQLVWRDVLTGAGAEYYLWKPSQWPEIETVLRGEQ